MIKLYCAACGKLLNIPDEQAGKQVKCSSCGKANTIPQPGKAKGTLSIFCRNCGKAILVKESQAGRKVRCTFCTTTNDVPGTPVPQSSSDEQSTAAESAEDLELGAAAPEAEWTPPPVIHDKRPSRPEICADFRDMPIYGLSRRTWAFIIAGVVAALIAGGVSLWLGLRDTWEKDNYDHIMALINNGDELLNSEKYDEAMIEYQAVMNLTKERELKNEDLQTAAINASYGFEKAKAAFDKAEGIKRQYRRHNPSISDGLSKGDLARKTGKFAEAVQHYDKVIKRIGKYSLQGQFAVELTRATEARRQVRADWEGSVVKEIDEELAKVKKALESAAFDDTLHICEKLVLSVQTNGPGTATVENGLKPTRDLLVEIPKLKQAYLKAQADRRAKEMEAERKRTAQMIRPLYEALCEVHSDFVETPVTDPVKLKAAEKKLSKICLALAEADVNAAVNKLRLSGSQVITAVRDYRECLASTPLPKPHLQKPQDNLQRKQNLGKWKLSLLKLGDAIGAAVYEYIELSKSIERQVVVKSAFLAKQLEAEKKKREEALLCPTCHGIGKVWCKACRVGRKVTGKSECRACGVNRRVTCPTCKGQWRKDLCRRCDAKGKVTITKRVWIRNPGKMDGHYEYRTTRKKCPVCKGKKYMWFCPACSRSTKSKRGTVPCPTCQGTGRAGECPTCRGTKKVHCTTCSGSGKRQLASF